MSDTTCRLRPRMRIGHLRLVQLEAGDGGRPQWECQCICGKRVKRFARYLARALEGGVRSHCGCKGSAFAHRYGGHPRPSSRCQHCEGMAHRRPPEGCPGCGHPFVPEQPIRAEGRPGCALGRLY